LQSAAPPFTAQTPRCFHALSNLLPGHFVGNAGESTCKSTNEARANDSIDWAILLTASLETFKRTLALPKSFTRPAITLKRTLYRVGRRVKIVQQGSRKNLRESLKRSAGEIRQRRLKIHNPRVSI
jgi:hypothetical protein